MLEIPNHEPVQEQDNVWDYKDPSCKIKELRMAEILEGVPTTQDFISSLEINSPNSLALLTKKYNRISQISQVWTFEEWLWNQIQPLFYSEVQNWIDDTEKISRKYALDNEWAIIEYTEMWNSVSHFCDRVFIWYWVFWEAN